MTFALLKISGSRTDNHSYVYSSTIMEMGASARWRKTFESESAMIATVNCILSRQKKLTDVGDVRHALSKIRDGEFYYFDLDLTTEEAKSLGWKASEPNSANKIRSANRQFSALPRVVIRAS